MTVAVLILAIIMTVVVVVQIGCRSGVFGDRIRELAVQHSQFRYGNLAFAAVLWAFWLYLRA